MNISMLFYENLISGTYCSSSSINIFEQFQLSSVLDIDCFVFCFFCQVISLCVVHQINLVTQLILFLLRESSLQNWQLVIQFFPGKWFLLLFLYVFNSVMIRKRKFITKYSTWKSFGKMQFNFIFKRLN